MHWFAFLAAGALAGKLVARYRRGAQVQQILEDPADVRTLARFELSHPAHARGLLAAIAEELAIDGWVVEDLAVRARRGALEIDVVRLVERGGAMYTLELTRAWTGPELGPPTRDLLIRIHDVLRGDPQVRHLGWHRRQDRALAIPHAAPVAI